MKQSVIISGFKAIEKINNMKFDGETAFKIYKLKKQLKEVYDFQSEQERNIFDQYKASFNPDGTIGIEDMSLADEFVAKITELGEIEHNDIVAVDVRASLFNELSIEDMETLEGIINFI